MRRVLKVGGIILTVLMVLLVGAVLWIPVDAYLGRDRVAEHSNLTVSGSAQELRVFIARPQGAGPYPAVIMIHEFWGLREDIVGKAQKLAAEGYVVVAPDMFRGNSTSYLPRAIYQTVSTPSNRLITDLNEIYAWLESRPEVDPERIAMLGFCFGGSAALAYSLSNPAVAATADFYGSTVISDPERLRLLQGPFLGVFGERDPSIPLSEVAALERGLAQAGVEAELRIFPGVGHAFVSAADPGQAGGAQAEAWQALLDFLQASLTPL